MKSKTTKWILFILLVLEVVLLFKLYTGNKNAGIESISTQITDNQSANIQLTNSGANINDSQGILDKIKLPAGFRIKYFATSLDSVPRFMKVINNTVFVCLMGSGKIVALIDDNKDGVADRQIIFMQNLNNVHSLDYYDGWFYIGEGDRITRVKDTNKDFIADIDTVEKLLDVPHDGGHSTRTVKVHNNSLYISIGSSCNVCTETDEKRAGILKCDLDGKNCNTYAKGLRNSVGIAFDSSGKMYATENSRDNLGDDIPPDEINNIEKGKDYGWPVCYGKNIHDTVFDSSKTNPCANKAPTSIDLQAHSAPLGINFYYGNKFPSKYNNTLFVAFHGSWNRQVPTGYKVVNINMNTKKVEDFAIGWLNPGDQVVIGRPVGIEVYQDSLLVSDDKSNNIYQIYYSG